MPKRKTTPAYICWAIIVLWQVLVFWFSAQEGGSSSQQSSALLRLLRLAGLQLGEGVIRKAARAFLYATLGVLATLATLRYRPALQALTIFSVVLISAVIDELHQHFVAGRAAQVSDVLLDVASDTVAALLTILVVAVIRAYHQKRKSPP